jgi:hypothetical protein
MRDQSVLQFVLSNGQKKRARDMDMDWILYEEQLFNNWYFLGIFNFTNYYKCVTF